MFHRPGFGRNLPFIEYRIPAHPGLVIKYFPGGRRRAPKRPVPLGPLLTTPLAALILLGLPAEALGEVEPVGGNLQSICVDRGGWTIGHSDPGGAPGADLAFSGSAV